MKDLNRDDSIPVHDLRSTVDTPRWRAGRSSRTDAGCPLSHPLCPGSRTRDVSNRLHRLYGSCFLLSKKLNFYLIRTVLQWHASVHFPNLFGQLFITADFSIHFLTWVGMTRSYILNCRPKRGICRMSTGGARLSFTRLDRKLWSNNSWKKKYINRPKEQNSAIRQNRLEAKYYKN